MNKEEFDEYITWEERVLDKLEQWVKYDKPITRKQAEETIDFICEQDNVIDRKIKQLEHLQNLIDKTTNYYLKTLAKNGSMPDEAVEMFNLLKENKR